MSTDSTVKRNVQKLQRVIVDALEGVKGQDIQVFNTETQSALFERVVVASGTSNRQTRALAMAVRDAVKEAGFAKPKLEGEENGEWIIVDCGVAVVHVMQPVIRQYYRLEELWGATPVRVGRVLATGAVAAKSKTSPAATPQAAAAGVKKVAVKRVAATTAKPSATTPSAQRSAKAAPAPAKGGKVRTAPKATAKPTVRDAVAQTLGLQPAKPKVAAKKAVAKKVTVKKVVINAATRKPTAKAASAKSTTAVAKKSAVQRKPAAGRA